MTIGSGSSNNGWNRTRGLIVKAAFLIGGALLLKKFTKSKTRWDHARIVAEALSGEKFSYEQACRDSMNYFNLRMLTCPATAMVDGSKVLYFEQAFWRTPEKPFRQRFYMVKPCSKELKCDVETENYTLPSDNSWMETGKCFVELKGYQVAGQACGPRDLRGKRKAEGKGKSKVIWMRRKLRRFLLQQRMKKRGCR